MTVDEFTVLDGLSAAARAHGRYWPKQWTTAEEINDQIPHCSPREIGYLLRGLSRQDRGLVESVGRRHGGALKWALTNEGFAVLCA